MIDPQRAYVRLTAQPGMDSAGLESVGRFDFSGLAPAQLSAARAARESGPGPLARR
jgi:hypothetical protein